MGLTTATTKHLLLLLNFIFAILGVVLICCGIFILVSGPENVNHGEYFGGGLIITIGILILITAIFGCLAAIHESRKKLIIYLGILLVLMLIKLSLISMASHNAQDGLAGSVREGFEGLWEIELKQTGALAFYEKWLGCCGVNGTEDYRNINHPLPRTCCKERICQVDNIFTEGCQFKFSEYLKEKLLTFRIVGWILIIVEIIAGALTWLLYVRLKNYNRNTSWM